MDIIVTTPKSRMVEAAQEAEDVIAAGGGDYFRRFPIGMEPNINVGDRVYYVEDGYVRGYAIVSRLMNTPRPIECDTTGRIYSPGFYVFMDATTWCWIEPLLMRGFQGFRYAGRDLLARRCAGDWLSSRPRICDGVCYG